LVLLDLFLRICAECLLIQLMQAPAADEMVNSGRRGAVDERNRSDGYFFPFRAVQGTANISLAGAEYRTGRLNHRVAV
jgi:hypothetical protein